MNFVADRWREVERVLHQHFYNPDIQAAQAAYAAIAAHYLLGAPVWPMLVAPPGSMKTELLAALDGIPRVHLIDQVTTKTFLSGQIAAGAAQDAPSSLLHRIGDNGIVVYSDFSTVLEMKRDDRGSVLADMRRIYDGHLHKEFGTSDNPQARDWQGRITFAVAATPEVDRQYSVFGILGERFVMIRWRRPGGVEAALKAMNQDIKRAKEDLRTAVHGLFGTLKSVEPTFPPELQTKMAHIAEIAVRARTQIPRNGYSKDMIYVPEAEGATRLAQQLSQLAKGSALLMERQQVSEDDYRLAVRVAFDCTPASRRKILDTLIAGEELEKAGLPRSTLHYAVEDLQSQDLIKGDDLSDLALYHLSGAGLLPDIA